MIYGKLLSADCQARRGVEDTMDKGDFTQQELEIIAKMRALNTPHESMRRIVLRSVLTGDLRLIIGFVRARQGGRLRRKIE